MKTIIYTYKGGKLSLGEEHEKIYQSPVAVLFSCDRSLSKEEIIKLLKIDTEIKIEEFASYRYTLEGITETPEYYTYNIFNN
ncbi:hypothetical protein [Dysgonomonas sp.]